MRIRSFTAVALTALTFVTWAGPARAQEEEEAGNNLSVPVIWSDGAAKTLVGTFGSPVFTGESFLLDGVKYYLQQDLGNRWQAESKDGTLEGPVDVSWIDWGDNLEARSWYETSVVRVETVLLKDLLTPMLGFEMAYLWGEGETEMWGTNTVTFASPQATVYSGVARLTIQKLLKDPGSAALKWDAANDQWVGDANPPVFNHGVWEVGEGKPTDRYSAEINIPGKIIYGYNWNVRLTGEGAGYYRITFSLEDDAARSGLPRNTFFTTTQIVPKEEEETEEVAEAEAPDSGGAPAGGVAGIDRANNLSYIDIQILASKGRKGGGGALPISTVSIQPDRPAPQPVHSSVTFTADSTGGLKPVQYKFWVYDGIAWTPQQEWSTDDTFVWNPHKASGDFRVGVWVRSADSTLDKPETDSAYTSVAYPITDVTPISLAGLTANLTSPQPVNTTITFTATAAGGTAPYEYKWWLFNGSTWSIVQTWSASSTFAWTPTVANANYRVGVWARSAGSTLDATEGSAYGSVPFVIVP